MPQKSPDKIKVAVLVENHEYDVVSFQHMLDSFADCHCYVQPVDLFIRDIQNRDTYDTVLWYNIDCGLPPQGSEKEAYLCDIAGSTPQGIVLLHHALLNYRTMERYTQISGIRDRGETPAFHYDPGQTVVTHIEDTHHPITAGINDFTVVDETYSIGEPEEDGNTILITTTTQPSIHRLAWTRTYKNSRVFCYASGHDNQTYGNESFRTILHNALRWTARRL